MATATMAFSPLPLVEMVGALPNVIKIFASQEGRTVHIWTVVDSFERDVRDRIYSVERNLFSYFPGYKFDFNVIEGSEDTIVSEAKLVYSAA